MEATFCATCDSECNLRCARCLGTAYCNAICHRLDFKHHRRACRRALKDRVISMLAEPHTQAISFVMYWQKMLAHHSLSVGDAIEDALTVVKAHMHSKPFNLYTLCICGYIVYMEMPQKLHSQFVKERQHATLLVEIAAVAGIPEAQYAHYVIQRFFQNPTSPPGADVFQNALQSLGRAARAGHPLAQNELSKYRSSGVANIRFCDDEQHRFYHNAAHKHLVKAAKAGFALAQFALGMRMIKYNVLERGKMYLQLAAAQGHTQAAKMLCVW